MDRYLAKLVFKINIENGKNNSQFDEQTLIIEAASLEDAFFKARLKGKKEEEEFLNTEKKHVRWEFIDVSELCAIDNVKDGEQIYSATHESDDAEFFIDAIRQKSRIIQTFFLTFA